MLLALSVPATTRFYQSMQYRQAVKSVVTTLGSARQQAINSGTAQDVPGLIARFVEMVPLYMCLHQKGIVL